MYYEDKSGSNWHDTKISVEIRQHIIANPLNCKLDCRGIHVAADYPVSMAGLIREAAAREPGKVYPFSQFEHYTDPTCPPTKITRGIFIYDDGRGNTFVPDTGVSSRSFKYRGL